MDTQDGGPRRRWGRAAAIGATALLLASVANYYIYLSFVGVRGAESDGQSAKALASRLREVEAQERDAALVASLVAALEEKRLVAALEEKQPAAPETAGPLPFQEAEDQVLGVEDDIHIAFSMSCDQGRRVLLQTVLQYSAEAVGQRGPITQILSGCSPEQQARILREEPALYHDFRRHFTPAYSPHPAPNVTDSYTPYNKPFSFRHFLRHADPPVTQRVVALLDGDTVFFKKLAVNTGADMRPYHQPAASDAWNTSQGVDDSVQDGLAVAQDWLSYLGSGWFAADNTAKLLSVCRGELECERALTNITESAARELYAGPGPPYVMTRTDAERMVDDYCDFLVRMREIDRGWMTEMYAFVVSAARHKIRFKLLTHLGVTHPSMDGEGREDWTFLADRSANATDPKAADPAPMQNPCEDDAAVVLPKYPPVSVHYCQKYGFVDGKGADPDHQPLGHFFYKYALPEELMQCTSELLRVPPASDWSELPARNWTAKYAGKSAHELAVARRRKYHELWFACSMTKVVNQAIVRYKRRACPSGYNTFRGIELERKEDDG